MATNWKEYQEEAADFFRALGMDASTDVRMAGVRTHHDIDVLAKVDVAGVVVRWIVECKHWQSPVNKLHVIALREIVSDLSADKGIILCEAGFQSGAKEAAKLTNVQATSLAEFGESSRDAIAAFRLKELFDRVTSCRFRYWELPKETRIQFGLRPEIAFRREFNGAAVSEVVEKYVSLSFRGVFPIEVDPYDNDRIRQTLPQEITNTHEAVLAFQPLISEFEIKLDAAEKAFQQSVPSDKKGTN
ncbi:MAG: restriction endonuclease [Alphaproteobacteria bacterium]